MGCGTGKACGAGMNRLAGFARDRRLRFGGKAEPLRRPAVGRGAEAVLAQFFPQGAAVVDLSVRHQGKTVRPGRQRRIGHLAVAAHEACYAAHPDRGSLSQDGGKEVSILAYHHGLAIAGRVDRVPSSGHGGGLCRIFQHLPQGAGERLGRIRWHQQSVLAFGYRTGRPDRIGGNNGLAVGPGLGDYVTE